MLFGRKLFLKDLGKVIGHSQCSRDPGSLSAVTSEPIGFLVGLTPTV